MSRVTPIRKEAVPYSPPKVLAVVAHPDDEYHFAVTLYRIVRELGGIADQVIITDGAGGHRYFMLAQQLYGLGAGQQSGSLRDIRRAETAVAGHVLGIRQHFFLDQPDTGFTLNQADAISDWNHYSVTEKLDDLLQTGGYDFVFILLPSEDTHGHHKATALLTLEAVERLPRSERPVVLAAEADSEASSARSYKQLAGHPATRASPQVYSVSRRQHHPADRALSYQIIANWVIAAHKSQGLFQMEAGRHDIERFWHFESSGPDSADRAAELFRSLQTAVPEPLSIPA